MTTHVWHLSYWVHAHAVHPMTLAASQKGWEEFCLSYSPRWMLAGMGHGWGWVGSWGTHRCVYSAVVLLQF